MSRVFISYLRNDSAADTGRLHDTLTGLLGSEVLFKDVADLEFGDSWKLAVHEALSDSVVVLVVMGPQWHPSPAILFELDAALSSNVRVVPVLVRDARIEDVTRDLPESLERLRDQHAISLDHDRWHRDCERLADWLRSVLEDPHSPKVRLDERPDANELLDREPSPGDRDGLLSHARDLAESLDDPSIWETAKQQHATFYDELRAAGSLSARTKLASTVEEARRRLRVEHSIGELLSRRPAEKGAEGALCSYAGRLGEYLDDPAIARRAALELEDFEEQLSEISRTRGDSGNPRAPQLALNEIVDDAMGRLAAELPGITRRHPHREWPGNPA